MIANVAASALGILVGIAVGLSTNTGVSASPSQPEVASGAPAAEPSPGLAACGCKPVAGFRNNCTNCPWLITWGVGGWGDCTPEPACDQIENEVCSANYTIVWGGACQGLPNHGGPLSSSCQKGADTIDDATVNCPAGGGTYYVSLTCEKCAPIP